MPVRFNPIKKVSLNGKVFNVPKEVPNKALVKLGQQQPDVVEILADFFRTNPKQEFFSKLFLGDRYQISAMYVSLRNIGLNQRIYIQKVFDPEGFSDIIQRLSNIELCQSVYVQAAFENPDLIAVFEKHKDKFTSLNQFELNQWVYVKAVLGDPDRFDDILQRLRDIALCEPVYVQAALKSPQRVVEFAKHTHRLVTLNALEPNQFVYVQKVLDDPEGFDAILQQLSDIELCQLPYIQAALDYPDRVDVFKAHQDKFALFNHLKLSQLTNIEAVLGNLEGFDEGYRSLKAVGLDQPKNIQAMLDNIEKFNENLQNLREVGLDQPKNIQAMLDNIEKFNENLQNLRKVESDQSDNIQLMLDNIEEFNENFQILRQFGLSQQLYIESILKSPNVIVNISDCSDELLMLEELGLGQTVYLQKVLDHPDRSKANLYRLIRMGLDQPVYVQSALKDLDRFDDVCQRLNDIELCESAYVQAVLDDPNRIAVFERHKDKFTSLNQFGLNQWIYVKAVLDDPKGFDDILQRLRDIALCAPVYVQAALQDPQRVAEFAKHTHRLVTLNALEPNQFVYVQKVLDNPEGFDAILQQLSDIELCQSVYVQAVLDDPNIITKLKEHQKKLVKLNQLGLSQPKYIQAVFDHPEDFERNLQTLEILGLNKTEYVQAIFDDPTRIDKLHKYHHLFFRLHMLGLSQPICVDAVFNNTEKYAQICSCLEEVKDRIETVEDTIQQSSLGQSREQGFKSHYPVYKSKVIQSSFDFLISERKDPAEMKAHLFEHEREFLCNSNIKSDRSSFGAICRSAMRALTNTIFIIVAPVVGYKRNWHKKNMSITEKCLPFYNHTESTNKVMDLTCDIQHTLVADF
ncbi:BspA family leucine-rich repeat surface protein [Piscirickettsia salmonis]|uniref:BspA family leucine-rich repeat surface protein n=1 Tax=Piscirickettsia salmonis TaxID=1238 RepID=UPI00166282B0|nr:BspA family leucine-rich repeat surface protein [Piscirickettsia salmonis]QNR82528.1 hypothetical protein ICC15_18905 [Piscirickettsia salmonis]